MGDETIAQRVIRVIAKNKKMAPAELSPATRFDELDALNIVFALEEEFDINVPNAQAAKMKSVLEAICGVEEALNAKNSPAN